MSSKSIIRDIVLGKVVLGLDGSALPREIVRSLEDAHRALCFEEQALKILGLDHCTSFKLGAIPAPEPCA